MCYPILCQPLISCFSERKSLLYITGGVLDCGGENAPTAEAQELFWPKVIRFLRENLKNDNTHL